MSGDLRERVTTFLTREADLADTHRYSEWLELWAPEGVYWVPANSDDYEPRLHVSIIYDDYARLQERCYRLSLEGAHSQDPPSRLCRVLGNVRLMGTDGEESPDELPIAANMVLMEVRSGIKNVYGAQCHYRLLETDGSFKIKLKKVILLDNDEPLGNLTFLL
jgi:3-phenylpropionate/cinnamic acid dioxygenase small subunit